MILRKITLFIEIPLFAFLRNFFHSSRSFRASAVTFAYRIFSAFFSMFLSLLMKWRAAGIMKATWLRRPTVVDMISRDTFFHFDYFFDLAVPGFILVVGQGNLKGS